MPVDLSRFSLPKKSEYDCISKKIERLLARTSGLAYTIYGSYVERAGNNFRAGFSDIDVFVLNTGEYVVPRFNHLQAYGEVLASKNTWIPVQTHWTTKGIIESPLSPGHSYLQEVKNGANKGKSSKGFSDKVDELHKPNDYKHDDVEMMAHFMRKVINATTAIYPVRSSIAPNLFEIHRIYEGYKRIFSIMILLTRIIDGKTRFSEKKSEAIRVFTEMTGTDIDSEALLRFDKETKNVFHWCHFFYHQDIESLRAYFAVLYREFEKIMVAILALPVKEEIVVSRTW